MARISFTASPTSTVGGDMRSLDLTALIGTMPVSFFSDRFIGWRAGDFSTTMDISGTGLAFEVSAGTLTDVTAGSISAIAFSGPGYSLSYIGAPMSADQFMGFVESQDWTGLATYLRAGDDTISGSRNRDVLLGGAGDDYLTFGYLSNDTLNGGDGNDTILASEGHDMLIGGAGADHFLFENDMSSGRQWTRIKDFSHGEDLIHLNYEAFAFLDQPGLLSPAHLARGTHAATADTTLIYDKSTGRLWIDMDGSGSAAHKVLMLEFTAGTTLSAHDFLLD